jgi:hypothetical protein
MLKITDFIREFPIVKKTDRDCEAVVLKEFITNLPSFESALDVGCHSSKDEGGYAETIRAKVKRYDGIDIVADPRLSGFLDYQYVGNVNTFDFTTKYDLVTCVSVIEHTGLSTYKADPLTERMGMFMKCLELAKEYMWISFPVGQEYTYPDQLSIITEKILKRWETLTNNFIVKKRFFYTQGAQAGHPWYEHRKRDVALKIPYLDYIGNQSICILEIDKT